MGSPVLSALRICFICITVAALTEALERRYDAAEIRPDASKHNLQFFNFVTRSDLDAPRWNVKVYNESAVAPGYWFIAPYGVVEQTNNDNAYVAPHIYSDDGDLIWSGASILDRYNTFSFTVSDVGGVDMLTMLYPHGEHAWLMNERYEVESKVYIGISAVTTNMHEFQVVDGGRTGLYLTKVNKKASWGESIAVGYNGECYVEFNGFEERDIATGTLRYAWNSEDHITLDESAMYVAGDDGACEGSGSWDWLHLNSVEKLPDGDFLVSGRRTYAVYKISRIDGSILWRLGGKKNDFDISGHFSGQHDVRCLSQNDTHMVLSMMDNAMGPGVPYTTNDYSRGLVLSVNTEEMTAKELIEYPHPQMGYSEGRGSFQIMPGGNTFCSWRDNALMSEYTADGTLIAEMYLPSGLKTYRGYKHPWVGLPYYPPDVHSQVAMIGGSLSTIAHVSWNGATEVHTWELYGCTDVSGSNRKLLQRARRTGFETALLTPGDTAYVVVQAIDGRGEQLGESRVTRTNLGSADTSEEAERLRQEAERLRQESQASTTPASWLDYINSLIHDPTYTFASGMLVSLFAVVTAALVFWIWKRLPQRRAATSMSSSAFALDADTTSRSSHEDQEDMQELMPR